MEPYAGMYRGLPLVHETPKWCCPWCRKPVGYVGNWMAIVFGARFHNCDFSNVRTSAELKQWMKKKNGQ